MSVFDTHDSKVYSKPNSVHIQKINDNQAKLHCDSIKTSNSEFLFNKSQTGESYQYDLTSLSGGQKYYGFNSKTNIEFNDDISSNSQLCGAITNAIAAPTVAGVATAVGTTGAAAIAAAPVAGAIVGAGGVAAANGVGFMAGAALATSVAVAAAPLAIVGGAVFGALAVD
jgi:hypothetical protein